MALLLYVEFDASSESAATKILENLSGMADLVHRDYPGVYTYVFRYANETKTKLIFTELYANEQVFLHHGDDPEFGKLLQEAFHSTAGKSGKELCIRSDINEPLLPITATILDNYLHVTYISLQQGFFYRNLSDKQEENLLIVCTDCDENVYEQLNTLVSCVTCLTFEESNGNRKLIAVITQISNEKASNKDIKPSIDTIELVCSDEETVQKFKDMIKNYFQVQSLHIQTKFSGYIRHKSS
jgi:hypothetical protein